VKHVGAPLASPSPGCFQKRAGRQTHRVLLRTLLPSESVTIRVPLVFFAGGARLLQAQNTARVVTSATSVAPNGSHRLESVMGVCWRSTSAGKRLGVANIRIFR